MEISESYLSVRYDLRPAKQVERRMILDSLILLAVAGFPVRDFQYTGMGSIHFVDFALFHKYFGIHSMLSVEASSKIKKRVAFNAPFRNAIELEIEREIGDVIPDLERTKQHFLWLDYDNILSDFMLRDLSLAANVLTPGSIIMVTVDTEEPKPVNDDSEVEVNLQTSNEYNQKYYEMIAGQYITPNNGVADFTYDKLPYISMKAILGAIDKGLHGRSNITFQMMYCFTYADGHRMLTMGGMIASRKDIRRLRGSHLAKAPYYRSSIDQYPCCIRVPALTRREQMHLDKFMPLDETWKLKEFELTKKDLEDYAMIYRFFPAYGEFLL